MTNDEGRMPDEERRQRGRSVPLRSFGSSERDAPATLLRHCFVIRHLDLVTLCLSQSSAPHLSALIQGSETG